MKSRTLYITFDGLSDPLGQSQILPYLIGLSEDVQITILSCEKPKRFDAEGSNIRALLQQKNISWHHIIYEEEGGFQNRLKNVLRLLRIAKALHSQNNFGLVHARSYLSGLVALNLKRKFGIPFIFDMRGFWADERIDGGIWKKNKPLHFLFYKYFKRKEKQFLSESSAIVSLTNAAVDSLEKQFPALNIRTKITVIPCCVNISLFDPEHTAKKNLKEIEPGDHVLIYTGSIGTWYYTKEMIDCFSIWQQKIRNLKLLVITKDIEEATEIIGSFPETVKSAILVKSASFKEIPSYLSVAKAAIFFIKPAFSKIASSPTKMAECWAMNLPIITNSGIGDNDLYFRHKKGGVLIDNFNHTDYQKSLNTYLSLTSEKNDFRNIAVKYFNTEEAIKSYKGIYTRILQN